MIEECNFKYDYKKKGYCKINSRYLNSFKECDGEDKCILYQIYKSLQYNRELIDNFTKRFVEGSKKIPENFIRSEGYDE